MITKEQAVLALGKLVDKPFSLKSAEIVAQYIEETADLRRHFTDAQVSLQKSLDENADLRRQLAEGKRLLSEEIQRANQRTEECIRLRDQLAEAQARLAELEGQEPVAWAVLEGRSTDDSGWGFIAPWPEACQEHINDAISEHGLEEAAQWKVVALYTRPAPAPADQKDAARIHPLQPVLDNNRAEFLESNRYELKYLPIYADQPDPTYIIKWVWEVRDEHGASVAEAHEWLYAAIDAAMLASKKGV